MAEPKIPVELLLGGKIEQWNEWKLGSADAGLMPLNKIAGDKLSDTNLKGAGLVFADLSDINFGNADLSDAELSCANLNGADLSRCKLWGTDFNNADMTAAELRKSRLLKVNLKEAVLIIADLSGAELNGVNLDGADLRQSTCHGTKFINCNLNGVQVCDWDATDAVFDGGIIAYAYLSKEGKNGPITYFKSVEEFAALWKLK